MPAPGRVTRILIIACAAVLTASTAFGAAQASPIQATDDAAGIPLTTSDTPDQPDIVVIYTDDQRKGTEKYMPQVQSLLAEQGVVFTDAHAPTSTCCPSRVSLLTGRLANETGVWTNWPPHGGFEAFMTEIGDADTIATRLGAVGYRTALVGKYLNGYAKAATRKTYAGSVDYIPPGWDVWHTYGGPSSVREPENSRYYDYWTMRSVDGSKPRYTYHGYSPSDYSTRVFGSGAVNAIRQAPASDPLFLVFAPYAPHESYIADPRHLNAPVPPAKDVPGFNDVSGKPGWLQRREAASSWKAQRVRTKQIRTLMGVDEAVANIVDALKRRGTLANTLLVFASDNGYTWGEFRLMGSKNYPYTTQVPLIMRWDEGGFTGGIRDSRLVANIDITKTVLSAAGADISGMTQALDLTDGRAKRQQLVIGAWRNRGKSETKMPSYCGMRTRTWLYAHYNEGAFEELYDLRRDPHMLDNLAYDASATVHRRALRDATQKACSPMPPDFRWGPRR